MREKQQQLAEETKEFNKQQEQQGIKSEKLADAQQEQQQAAKKLDEQDFKQAEKKQQQAIEDLQQAQKEVEQQQQQQQDKKQQEAMLNVAQEITEILDAHQQQHGHLHQLIKSVSDNQLPRSARIQLKKVAAAELDISYRADDLLLEISDAGADSFPFFILSLMEDHQQLSESLTSSSIVQKEDILLSAYLIDSWQELLDIMDTERERQRQQSDSPNQSPNDESEKPLIQFAAELQLLKRMQTTMSQRLELLKENPNDELLQELIVRQSNLHLQYESMIRRIQGAEESTPTEEL